jgi:putative membrane protein
MDPVGGANLTLTEPGLMWHHRLFASAAIVVAAAALNLASPSGTDAQQTQQPLQTVPTQSAASPSSIPVPDLDFVLKAAVGGAEEVALGNLAQQKATTEDVKRLADTIVRDHSQANEELKQLAESKGIAVPASTTPASQTVAAAMSELPTEEFEKQYVAQQHGAHVAAVQMFQHAAQHATDADVRAFAEKHAPKIEAHTADLEKVFLALK